MTSLQWARLLYKSDKSVARTSGIDIRNKRVRFLQFSWLWLFEHFSLNKVLYVRVKYKLGINSFLDQL